jgi:hypothetical protein
MLRLARWRARTCNLRFRRPLLYPVELSVRQNSGLTVSSTRLRLRSIGKWSGAAIAAAIVTPNEIIEANRKISAVNDPYDWVSKNWEGNPIEIPLKS